MKKNIIIISGPTGVGKTDFVDELVKKQPSEIINLDVGQFYEPISIGTAKPDWANHPVRHHLFDIIKNPVNITVVEYRKLVLLKVEEIWQKQKLPILVGGSGFYLLSLFFPPLETKKISDLISGSWEDLNSLDPKRAAAIDPADSYRIDRALTLLKGGQKPSDKKPVYQSIGEAKIKIINRDRKDLYDRINQRTDSMIEDGWIKEVESLSEEWKGFLKKKKLIGYDLIIDYLDKKIDFQKLKTEIKKQTRRYAKRQLTFFRMIERKLQETDVEFEWFNLT